jgi:hypothetical protein
VTNYNRNILEQDYMPSNGKFAELIFSKGRYNVYQGDLKPGETVEVQPTPFEKKYTYILAVQDSVNNVVKKNILMSDLVNNSIISGKDTFELDIPIIDINNYVFEREKLSLYNEKFRENNFNIVLDTVTDKGRCTLTMRPHFILIFLSAR